MAEYKLTIAIPTYNRPKQLGNTLSVILPQVLSHDDVQLIILDNCSPVPAEDVLQAVAKNKQLPRRIKVIRHIENIGGNGNMLRCFEVAEGDWLWCLGDDDEPATNAVDIILNDIADAQFCYVYYRIFENAPILNDCDTNHYVGSSIEEWIKRVPAYGHRLFISSSLFRLAEVRQYLMVGYMAANSGGPHLIMAFLSVINGGKYMLSGNTICNYSPPVAGQRYNCAPLAYASTSVMLLIGKYCNYRTYKLFFYNSFSTWVAPQRLLYDVIQLHGISNACLVRKCFNIIASQFKPQPWNNIAIWLRWTLCQIFSIFPKLFISFYKLRHRNRKI